MRMLLPVSLLLMLYSAIASAEVDANGSNEAKAPVAKRWYAGGALLEATLDGWNGNADNYYSTLGYMRTGGSFWNVMTGINIYGGYRMRDFLDVELGLPSTSMTVATTYQDFAGNIIWSKRKVNFSALYLAALVRPKYGYGHMLYLKLGVHASNFSVTKSATGSPPNIAAIVAGDQLPGDGSHDGFGPLIGIGLDFRTGKVGAVRLEFAQYFRIGGTAYNTGVLSLGYQGNF